MSFIKNLSRKRAEAPHDGGGNKLIGTIDPAANSLAEKSEWIALIATHPLLLGNSAQKEGINPFTGNPMFFKPHGEAAAVFVAGAKIGVIHWAMDNSRQLIVWSKPEAIDFVTIVANDVAGNLGWQFVARQIL